jgi:hypothetical protein
MDDVDAFFFFCFMSSTMAAPTAMEAATDAETVARPLRLACASLLEQLLARNAWQILSKLPKRLSNLLIIFLCLEATQCDDISVTVVITKD